MLRNILLLSSLSLLFFSCAGHFKATVKQGSTKPTGENLAITYLDHPDINISNMATSILEDLLKKCDLNLFTPAAKTDEIFQTNNITIPRRLTQNFVKSLKDILQVKYVFVGAVTYWDEGSVGFPVASSTEVGASFSIYELETGDVIWTVTGQEEGAAGIFAESPETKARSVFLTMLKKWPGFCEGVQ